MPRLPLRPRDVAELAAQYEAAPAVADKSLVPLWQDYGHLMLSYQASLADDFYIRIVNDENPYANGAHLLRDLIARKYRVPAPHACPVHPVWDGQTFAAARTVHDLTGHGASGTDFTLPGEIPTFHQQAEWLRCVGREDLIVVVFSDTLQQLCNTLAHHRFAPQKVVVPEDDRCLERCLSYDV